MDVEINIDGLKEVQRKLGRVAADAVINRGIKAAALHLKGRVAIYPPNQPPANPRIWYVRGYGSKWKRKDGSIGRRQSSETLGKKWTIKTGHRWATVGNNVSYGPYVQGPTQQTKVMERRGWKTTKAIADEEQETVVAFISSEIQKEIKR